MESKKLVSEGVSTKKERERPKMKTPEKCEIDEDISVLYKGEQKVWVTQNRITGTSRNSDQFEVTSTTSNWDGSEGPIAFTLYG